MTALAPTRSLYEQLSWTRAGAPPDPPTSLVYGVVVRAAERKEVVQIGWPTVLPRCDVVRHGVLVAHLASWNRAGGMHRAQGATLGRRGQAFTPSDIERHALTAEYHGHDLGRARHATEGVHRQIHPVTHFDNRALVEAALECLQIDDNAHLGNRCWHNSDRTVLIGCTLDEREQGKRLEMVVLSAVVGAGARGGRVEEPFNSTVQPTHETHPGLGVEFAAQAEHAGIAIGPVLEIRVAALLVEPRHTAIGLERSDEPFHRAVELLGRGGGSKRGEVPRPLGKLHALALTEARYPAGEGVDVRGRHLARLERHFHRRHQSEGIAAAQHLLSLPTGDATGTRNDLLLIERVWFGEYPEPTGAPHTLSLGPRNDASEIAERRFDLCLAGLRDVECVEVGAGFSDHVRNGRSSEHTFATNSNERGELMRIR